MAKSKLENLRSSVDYVSECRTWTYPKIKQAQSDIAVGVLAMLLRRKSTVDLRVQTGNHVCRGDILAMYGHYPIHAPASGTVTDVNTGALGRPLEGGDWIVRIRPDN